MLKGFGLAAAAACTAFGQEPLAANARVAFNINAPTLMAALVQFTQQSGLQMVFATDGATQIPALPVAGELTPRAALEKLLKDSGLRYEFVNERTIVIKPATRAVTVRE